MGGHGTENGVKFGMVSPEFPAIEFRIDQMSNRLRNIEKQFHEIQHGEQSSSQQLSGPGDEEPQASER